MPDPELQYWATRAAEQDALHKQMYPDYDYKPRKSKDIKRRPGKAAQIAAGQAVEENQPSVVAP